MPVWAARAVPPASVATANEFQRVQAFLGRKGGPRPKIHFDFPYAGLIRCGDCGLMVTAEEKHQVICGECRLKFARASRSACPRCEASLERMENPLFLHYTYYHCSRSKKPVCRQKSVSGQEIERQIQEELARIDISVKFKDWAIEYLHELHEREAQLQVEILESQKQAYRACLGQIEGLVSLKTSPNNKDGSLLSDAEYAERRSRLMKEKTALEDLLHGADYKAGRPLMLSREVFKFACQVQERFAKGNAMAKKTILDAIASNLTLKDKKLLFEAKKPFTILKDVEFPDKAIIMPIEPENTTQKQGRKVTALFMRPTVCAY
ncbi:MAG: hypothetical protein KGL39_33310 [Patescibacteria group bacterium]|nr:hypothetical protein [Patescibacteria group bacterium]